MKLTRSDLIKASTNRQIGKIRWQDLRGSMRTFAEADVVTFHCRDRVQILKDRQGQYLKLPRDKDGCVSGADMKGGVQ